MHGIVRSLAFATALAAATAAYAEDAGYPSRPVCIVVPLAAGGPPDVISRLVAQKLSERWRQQVYVENLPGAGGNTGTATAARAAPDGYTLYMMSTGFMVNPSLYAKVPYDPIKDFAPDDARGSIAEHPVRPSVGAGAQRHGADRPHQEQSGHVQLRPAIDRIDAASVGRIAQAPIRARPRNGAVQRRVAGGEFNACGPYAAFIHAIGSRHRQQHGGRPAGARTAGPQAARRPARPDQH